MNKAEALILKKTKQVADAAGAVVKPLGDMRLNKSGTVGTEPIQNPGDPQVRTEVKMGRFGAFQIPTVKDGLNTVKKTVKTMKASAADIKASVQKDGFKPGELKGIIGDVSGVKAARKARNAK